MNTSAEVIFPELPLYISFKIMCYCSLWQGHRLHFPEISWEFASNRLRTSAHRRTDGQIRDKLRNLFVGSASNYCCITAVRCRAVRWEYMQMNITSKTVWVAGGEVGGSDCCQELVHCVPVSGSCEDVLIDCPPPCATLHCARLQSARPASW